MFGSKAPFEPNEAQIKFFDKNSYFSLRVDIQAEFLLKREGKLDFRVQGPRWAQQGIGPKCLSAISDVKTYLEPKSAIKKYGFLLEKTDLGPTGLKLDPGLKILLTSQIAFSIPKHFLYLTFFFKFIFFEIFQGPGIFPHLV